MFQHDTHLPTESFANRFSRIIKIESAHNNDSGAKDMIRLLPLMTSMTSLPRATCHCMQNVVWEIAMHRTVVAFMFKW